MRWTALAVLALTLAAHAEPTEDLPPPSARHGAAYKSGMDAVKSGDYKTALKNFEEANKLKKDDPDTLNMLAYSQRKNGMLDAAIANYTQALKLRPKFPEAREYLGEAYLESALAQLAVLNEYGPEADGPRQKLKSALAAAADRAAGGAAKANAPGRW